MDWLPIERGIWSAVFGAVISLIVVVLVVPFGALAQIVAFCVLFPIGAVVVYRFGFGYGIGRRADEPGRLTLSYLVGFVIALAGYVLTAVMTNDGSIPELFGQALSLGIAWWLANWLVYREGLHQLRGRVTG